MSENQLDYTKIRHIAEQELKREKRLAQIIMFIVSLVIAIVFTLVVWAVGWANLGPQLSADTKSPLWALLILPTVGFFITMLMHGVSTLLNFRAGEQSLRERATLRAIQHEIMGLADQENGESPEKPKREQVMHLTDDGELIPEDTDSHHIQNAGRN